MFYISSREEEIESYEVIYMRRVGAYGESNRILMENFKSWLKEHDLYTAHNIIFAIPLDNPITTEANKCRYDVCTIYPSDQNTHIGEVTSKKIEGGKFIVFLIEHTAVAVESAWDECFAEIKRIGYQLDESRPTMERYARTLVEQHLCEICVPIL